MIPMTARVDQFAAVHERKEGELYVDWDEVRGLATSGSKEERRLAQALLAMGRRVEGFEDAISSGRLVRVSEQMLRWNAEQEAEFRCRMETANKIWEERS